MFKDKCICKYCGSTLINLDNINFNSEEEAINYATSRCKCNSSIIFQNKLKAFEELHKFLKTLDYSDDIKEFIKQCFSFISNHPSDVVVYKFDIYNVKFCYKKDKFKLEIVESKKSERTF